VALREFARREAVHLVRNDRNRGKGYSVKRGILAAAGRYRVFTDADLAYPLDEIWRIVAALQRGADVAIACRVLPESRYVMSAGYFRYLYTRHIMSRAFNRVARTTLLPGIFDTQAGLKGFTARAAREVFSRQSIPGFGFDLEVLYVARRQGLRIEQVPVHFRYDSEPSTVRFVRDGVAMIGDLARIRWRNWTGAYEAHPMRALALDEGPHQSVVVSRT
jgi:dolichyl-phosphate beta-glucosyltransferase